MTARPANANGTAGAKTVLIGLDGATFTILDPLMAKGVMPRLRGLVARGTRATLQSVIPALTPPAWTSLMTGKRPGEHGVFDFFGKDSPESHYIRFTTSHDVRSETIWSLASQHGRRVIALNFPLMFPPPAVNGCVVPGGWMPWRQLRLGCYPPGIFDRLKALPSFDARELALDMAFEEKAIEGCAAEEYAGWIDLHMRRERRWFDVLTYLMREEPADLTAVLFDGVDKLQHLCWRFLDPALQPSAPTAWEKDIAERCEAYFRQLDGLIGEIVDLAGPGANVLFASDHGFGPTSDVFYVNTWLEQHGYLAWADASAEGEGASSARQSGDVPQVGFGQMARHVFQLDWDRTVAYAATPSSNGIHIVTHKPDGSTGVPADDYARLRTELSERLLGTRDPQTGAPVVSRVATREEAFAGPYEALAPDLSLMLANGGVVSILRSDTWLKRRPEPAGTHRAEGIFIGAGPAIRRGGTATEFSIVDMAPLLLYCLDVPVPQDMSGQVPLQVLDPLVLQQRPPRAADQPAPGSEPVPAMAAAAAKGPDAPVFDQEAEITMMKRLRALGYVE